MNILITGGVGFIGFNLVKSLCKKNKITIIDDLSRGKIDHELRHLIKKYKIKLLKLNLRKKIKLNNNFDYVFHLAATVGVRNVSKNPTFTLQNNILGLFNLINFCKSKSDTKLIFFSTSEVYSPLIEKKIKNIFPLKENSELFLKKYCIPRDSYYLSKLFSEKIVEISGLDYIIYRPHNIYGPRMGSSHVIPELINKLIIKKNKIIKIYSPNHKRVFCYIDDCIFQVISTCFNKKFLNNVINLGSSQKEIKIYDLAKLINKFATKQKKITPGNVTLGSPYRRIPSINKISSVVRKYKETKLDQGIKKTIEWYKND